MSSTTGLILSYALGIIFAIGGLAFLILLDERRFLFGVPYLIMGILLIGGVRASQRRKHTRQVDDADGEDPPTPRPH
jgi:hypothetical protein